MGSSYSLHSEVMNQLTTRTPTSLRKSIMPNSVLSPPPISINAKVSPSIKVDDGLDIDIHEDVNDLSLEDKHKQIDFEVKAGWVKLHSALSEKHFDRVQTLQVTSPFWQALEQLKPGMEVHDYLVNERDWAKYVVHSCRIYFDGGLSKMTVMKIIEQTIRYVAVCALRSRYKHVYFADCTKIFYDSCRFGIPKALKPKYEMLLMRLRRDTATLEMGGVKDGGVDGAIVNQDVFPTSTSTKSLKCENEMFSMTPGGDSLAEKKEKASGSVDSGDAAGDRIVAFNHDSSSTSTIINSIEPIDACIYRSPRKIEIHERNGGTQENNSRLSKKGRKNRKHRGGHKKSKKRSNGRSFRGGDASRAGYR